MSTTKRARALRAARRERQAQQQAADHRRRLKRASVPKAPPRPAPEGKTWPELVAEQLRD